MKRKVFLVFLFIFGIGCLLGFIISKTIIQSSGYHTEIYISKIEEDLDNDSKKETIELEHTVCYKISRDNKEMPVGCPGPICAPINNNCDKPYIQIIISGLNANKTLRSDKTYTGAFAGDPVVSEISTASFGKDKLIVVERLSVGVHGSVMRIFKTDNNSVIPVCRNKVIYWSEDSKECAFYSDVGGPDIIDLDNDGTPEVVEQFYNYSATPRQIILGEVSVYDGKQFITQEGESYQKYLKLFQKINRIDLEIISRDTIKK